MSTDQTADLPADSDPTDLGAPIAPPDPPLVAYRAALRRYDGARLVEVHARTGGADLGGKATRLPDFIADRLAEPRAADRLVAALPPDSRLALGLVALAEATEWPAAGLALGLRCLGVDPLPALRRLAEVGLVAVRVGDGFDPVHDLDEALGPRLPRTTVLAHPSALNAARTVLPERRRRVEVEVEGDVAGEPPTDAGVAAGPTPGEVAGPPAVGEPVEPSPAGPAEPTGPAEPIEPPPPPEPVYEELLAEAGAVRQVREADGLEPILRLAAAWQRIDEGAIRQTQQGTYFKRDRERLEDDLVLAGPIADAIEPLPDMALLWVAMARAVGLVVAEGGSDRLVAADPEFWDDNAVHLPQMVATKWLALRAWHECLGMVAPDTAATLAAPFLRSPALLWLATRAEDAWVALDDLAALWDGLAPGWDRPILAEPGQLDVPRGADLLAAILLGPSYQLGLIRVAEEVPAGRRAVQLTPLGRYALALGPPPAPRPAFEHFLLAQPNFEMIAYRQGLTPRLIGQFSRFARWTQIGAALELKLTPDSVYRGLEGGLTTDAMLDRLTRHSARPLPAGVAEAIRTWAGRRDRVTYFASTTLVEFATGADLEAALRAWPAPAAGRSAPSRVSERLLLVEDEGAIPFTRFRMVGARDYRRPPEVCVDVDGDGVTLALDLGRSDLLVDAELARFADEIPAPRPASYDAGSTSPRRWFRVAPGSLARAAGNGMTITALARWFEQRAGEPVPAAVRLLLHAADPRVAPFGAARPIIMTTPTPELLDGLLQHPATGAYLDERLGPTAVIVPDAAVADLRAALATLGLALGEIGAALPRPTPAPMPPPAAPRPAPASTPAAKPTKSPSKPRRG